MPIVEKLNDNEGLEWRTVSEPMRVLLYCLFLQFAKQRDWLTT